MRLEESGWASASSVVRAGCRLARGGELDEFQSPLVFWVTETRHNMKNQTPCHSTILVWPARGGALSLRGGRGARAVTTYSGAFFWPAQINYGFYEKNSLGLGRSHSMLVWAWKRSLISQPPSHVSREPPLISQRVLFHAPSGEKTLNSLQKLLRIIASQETNNPRPHSPQSRYLGTPD